MPYRRKGERHRRNKRLQVIFARYLTEVLNEHPALCTLAAAELADLPAEAVERFAPIDAHPRDRRGGPADRLLYRPDRPRYPSKPAVKGWYVLVLSRQVDTPEDRATAAERCARTWSFVTFEITTAVDGPRS